MREAIVNGKTALGLELGSTRIKAVLIGEAHEILASGQHEWENKYEGGFWTYSYGDILDGLKSCYLSLKADVFAKYGVKLCKVGAMGISAMMHGYMVFDKYEKPLVPFRTWRNNNAAEAADELTQLFGYRVPARWSVAHLYHAVKSGEPHVRDIAFQTTLEGYIHYLLTGQKIIGIGEGSGMFPIDIKTRGYNAKMLEKFDNLTKKYRLPFKLEDILPKVLQAGESAGALTEAGARLLDPEGDLQPGIPFCPPEGDAGTGMVATNCVKPGTGNVSAGTSIFGMVVTDREPLRVHPEIDLVTTPCGDLVAMVHCNNCTSEINAWVKLFDEFAVSIGAAVDRGELYGKLFLKALEGDADCGGVLSYNYLSGENITQIDEGRPLLVRTTESSFNLANFMRSQIYSAFATLKIGLDILTGQEDINIDGMLAHGGIFKTKGVAQRFLAAAINAPVTVNTAGNEGGPFGMALLAMYMLKKEGMSLAEYLDTRVFFDTTSQTVYPDAADVAGFDSFNKAYVKGLTIVREAVAALKR